MQGEILDLTRVIDENLEIYAMDGYTDPPLRITPWSSLGSQGFSVSRLEIGTQTGTHIDAPAHFIEGGDTLDALPVSALIGPYICLDVAALDQALPAVDSAQILFLTSSRQAPVEISSAQFLAMLGLPCQVWVMAFPISVREAEEFTFHRELAKAGKYLVEDLDETAAALVRPGGEIIALPLRLTGVSGSPCRVIVLNRKD